jgi:hypothetical protein
VLLPRELHLQNHSKKTYSKSAKLLIGSINKISKMTKKLNELAAQIMLLELSAKLFSSMVIATISLLMQ